jgi:hypothetical protein
MFLDYIRPSDHGEGSVGEFPLPPPNKLAYRRAVRGLCLGLPSPIRDKLQCEIGASSNVAVAAMSSPMRNSLGQ